MSDGSARTLKQSGAALLLSFLLLFVGALMLALPNLASLPVSARENARLERTLREAKRALIEYAVNYAEIYGPTGAGPGHLPCPDRNGDGIADANCGPNSIGFLPRKLSGAAFEFSTDTTVPIWYAVADSFKYNPSVKVNSGTIGSLMLDGTGDIAAVLISPGDPLPGQTRPSTTVADYLEGENADGDAFFASVISTHANDLVIGVPGSEILSIVEGRVTGEFRRLAQEYRTGCGVFPFAVPFASPAAVSIFDSVPGTAEGLFPVGHAMPTDWNSGCASGVLPPAWIEANDWHRFLYFSVCPGGGACITVSGKPTHAAFLLSGAPLSGQVRNASSTLGDYFESDNADGTTPFVITAIGAFNDVVLTLE